MNFWMHFRLLWRMVLSVRRPVMWPSLVCGLLALAAGVYFTGSSPLSAQTTTNTTSTPEYIYNPPRPFVSSTIDDYKVVVEFAWNPGNAEPPSTLFPVVYWYRNGNYIAKVTSTFKNRVVDGGGTVWWDCYDPYTNAGAGFYYPHSFPQNRRKIAWQNSLPVSIKDITESAIYTAYIPVLDATTEPAQVVLTPAQALGGSRPSLEVVRSPSDRTALVGGTVSLWADVKSHVNGLMQNPYGIAVDSTGLVYVADTTNHGIRKILPGGRGRTIAGLDGGILDASGKDIDKQTAYDPEVNSEPVYGELVKAGNPTYLRLTSLTGVAPGSRLILTGGSQNIENNGQLGTLPSPLTVANVYVSTGSVAVDVVNTATSSGTLTFSVRSATPARAIFKDRPATDGFSWADKVSSWDPLDPPTYRSQSDLNQVDEPLLNSPEAVATVDDGSVFVADTANNAIRRIYVDAKKKTHVQTLWAGTQRFAGTDLNGQVILGTLNYSNLTGSTASITSPSGLFFSRGISITGNLTSGSAGVTAVSSTLGLYAGASISGNGIPLGATISSLAGGSITISGTATTSGTISLQAGVPCLYILDFDSIKKFSLNDSCSSVVSATYIGRVTPSSDIFDDREAIRLYAPRGMVVTRGRNEAGQVCRVIYVADTINHVIRKLTLNPAYSEEDAPLSAWKSELVAGWVGSKAQALDINRQPVNNDGSTGYFPPVTFANCQLLSTSTISASTMQANISVPSTAGITVGDNVRLGGGTFTVGSIQAGTLITTGSVATLTVGTYEATINRAFYAPKNVARLAFPSGIAMDARGDIYFTEMGTHNIRRLIIDDVNPGVGSRVETIAGQSQAGPFDGGKGEGTGKAAAFFYPAAIAFDSTTYPYSFVVADSANHCIRRLSVSTTVTSGSGSVSMDAPTKIAGLSSVSNIAPMMRVSGLNFPRGAYVVDVDQTKKLVTVNVPASSALSNSPISFEKDVFSSSNFYGYTGFPGNHDYAGVNEEYDFQWQRFGRSLQNIGNVVGANTDSLNLSSLRLSDSGPYELKVINIFGISAYTMQSSVYVSPRYGSDDAKSYFFTEPYTRMLISGTSELVQLRSDSGPMSFSLQANITHADNIKYKWQMVVDGEEIDLTDSQVERNFNSKVARLLGNDGVGGLSLEGTDTAKLQITGFQQSIVDGWSQGQTVPLPAVTFQVKAISLTDGTRVVQDWTGANAATFTFRASFGPMIPNGPTDVRVIQFNNQLGVQDQSAKVDKDSPFTLVPMDEISAFPLFEYVGETSADYSKEEADSLADKKNPTFGVKCQWFTSDRPPGHPLGNPTAVGNVFKYKRSHNYTSTDGALEISKAEAGQKFYWVRYWTGSGSYEDNNPLTVIGKPKDGNFVAITTGAAVSLGSVDYKTPVTGGEKIKILYVNAPDPSKDKQEFLMDVFVTGASALPTYKWKYLKWGEDAVTDPTKWKYLKWGTSKDNLSFVTPGVIASGTIVTGTIWAVSTTNALDAEPLGQGMISGTKFDASLKFASFEKMEALDLGDLPSKDLSGLYCLETTVEDDQSTFDKANFWILAARQKPAIYGANAKSDRHIDPIYTATLDGVDQKTQTSISINRSSKSQVVFNTSVLIPLPDRINIGDVYGDYRDQNGVYRSKIDDLYHKNVSPPGNGGDDLPGFHVTAKSDLCATSSIFKWRRGVTPVSSAMSTIGNGTLGSTTSSLKISEVGDADLGKYSLAVDNFCGSLVNLGPLGGTGQLRGWVLYSDGTPNLMALPSAKSTSGKTLLGTRVENGVSSVVQRVAQGQMVALEVPVSSSQYLQYVWYYSPTRSDKGNILPNSIGTADGKYFIRSAALKDSGFYRVQLLSSTFSDFRVKTDVYGDWTKWPTLTLLVEPMPDPDIPRLDAVGTPVIVSGSSRTLIAGGTATLSAVSLGTGVSFLNSGTTSFFTFQWKKNGVPLVGETKETLKLSKLTKSQAGFYSVDVTGVAGTKTSAALTLAIASSATSTEKLYPVTFRNLQGTKYYTVPSVTSGVAAGTPIAVTGMSSSTQTLLGWRVWDAEGNAWNLPARGAQFIMPANAVTIEPTMGRSSVGMYSGFLTLEKPWGNLAPGGAGSVEWDIYSLTSGASAGENNHPPRASLVRGYFTAMITSLGAVSGKVIVEGKSYPFTSTFSVALDGNYSAPIKIQTILSDRTPWTITGSISLNMGLKRTGTLTSGSNRITIAPSAVSGGTLSGLAETMSVTAYGLPEGTMITSIPDRDGNTVEISSPATLSSGTTGSALMVGENMAKMDNVAHVSLDDVVLEVTPPAMKSGRPLWGVAACNAGAYDALRRFITAESLESAPMVPKYTSAIFRQSLLDVEAVPGRGGVLSTSVSNIGLATVVGWLPNGMKLTFSGYSGRACFVAGKQDVDPLAVFVPAFASKQNDLEPVKVEGAATAPIVMQEAIERHSSSVLLPIWSTSPLGDKPGEPLFGALILSDRKLYGCMGVLNAAAFSAAAGSVESDSEYTHNYVAGHLYDPTLVANWTKPVPFTPTAKIALSSFASSFENSMYPLENMALPTSTSISSVSQIGTTTALGTLGYVGSNFFFTPSIAVQNKYGSTGLPITIVFDVSTGLFSGTFVEKTDKYVVPLKTALGTSQMGPRWAVQDKTLNLFKSSLVVSYYAATIQGNYGEYLNLNVSPNVFGGARGFLLRGTTDPEKLKNTLGNGFEDNTQNQFIRGQWTYDGTKDAPVFRTEGFNIDVFESN